jgi:hypothetical protein
VPTPLTRIAGRCFTAASGLILVEVAIAECPNKMF